MKKFLFVRHGYFPDDPRLKKQVRALTEYNCKVDVLCLKKQSEKFFEKTGNETVIRIPLSRKRSFLFWYFIEYTISFIAFFLIINFLSIKEKYNFIIVHTLPDYLTFVTILPKILGIKVVTDFHEPTPELLMTKYNYSEKHLLVRLAYFIEQSVIKYSDFSITVTKALRERFISKGADPEKVFVISNAIDESDFKKYDIAKKEKYDNEFRIVTHGSIEERYGHEVVIRAIKLLRNDYPGIKYIITGDGTYTEELVRLTKQLNLNGNIEFKGYLPFNQLLEVLSTSDAGIIPMYSTPYSELIDTNKMYEFFEIGIPVIVSRLKPIEENFNESEVVFFKPGDSLELSKKIKDLLLNKKGLSVFVENAKLKYITLRWAEEKKKLLNYFHLDVE